MQQHLACLTIMLSAALIAGKTPAQAYPTKPIRVIVAASAGGPSDFIVRIVSLPDVRERLTSQGYDPAGDTVEEFDRYLRAELVKWAKVIKASGARAN